MKIKLAYKLFITLFLTSLISILMMVGIMEYFVARNFKDFLNKMEMERLNWIAERLSEGYRKNNGWSFVTGDPAAFNRYLQPTFPGKGHEMGPPDLFPPNRRPVPGGIHEPPPPMPPRFDGQRMTLFDARKHVLAGGSILTKDHMLKEIIIDGKTVGWLGLDKRSRPPNPLAERFLSQQSEAFSITGCAVLVVAALFSFLLSRHLLRPVGRLAKGANALASRKFDTRIEVSSGDELGQLADDFNRMAETLEHYEELRKQWISDISHELRTPLAILRGEIEAIQDGVREMTRENMESLHAEIMLLGKLVNDLHELSMVETGSLSAKREPVDVIKILKDTIGMFTPRFSQASIEINYDRSPDRGVMVMGDRDRLAQVFANILENTLRYTESPGELRVSWVMVDKDVQIIFEDSDPGVPDKSLDRLFDRLYRVDTSRSRKCGGSGLGLAICKNIVESFGGKIRADHASIGGLRLEILLPLSKNA